jgi:hypothetical protein
VRLAEGFATSASNLYIITYQIPQYYRRKESHGKRKFSKVFSPHLRKMEAVDNGSAYPPPTKTNSNTFESPQDFSPFNSPPPVHKTHAIKKRKRTTDHEHSNSVDATAQGGFNVLDLNSPVQSNPDIDAFIRSRRKPREKKSCQICRYKCDLFANLQIQ